MEEQLLESQTENPVTTLLYPWLIIPESSGWNTDFHSFGQFRFYLFYFFGLPLATSLQFGLLWHFVNTMDQTQQGAFILILLLLKVDGTLKIWTWQPQPHTNSFIWRRRFNGRWVLNVSGLIDNITCPVLCDQWLVILQFANTLNAKTSNAVSVYRYTSVFKAIYSSVSQLAVTFRNIFVSSNWNFVVAVRNYTTLND